jgi:hypothetical protein
MLWRYLNQNLQISKVLTLNYIIVPKGGIQYITKWFLELFGFSKIL